mgnify:CR=1 FL=1
MNATVLVSLCLTLIMLIVLGAHGFNIYELVFSVCIFYFAWWILVSYADNLGIADRGIQQMVDNESLRQSSLGRNNDDLNEYISHAVNYLVSVVIGISIVGTFVAIDGFFIWAV